MCYCGCNVVFHVTSNIRGALIRFHELYFILEDKLYNDNWEKYIGGLLTWGEFKNKIIGKTQIMNNNHPIRDNNNHPFSNNNNHLVSNVWLHLYNQYIRDDSYQNIPDHTLMQTIYIY
jgi:hypothetical protein